MIFYLVIDYFILIVYYKFMKKNKLKIIISLTCVVILVFSSVIGIVLNSLSKRVKDYTQNLSYA